MQDRTLEEKLKQAEALYMVNRKPQEAAKLFKELAEVNYLPALLHLDRLYWGPLKNKAESARYLQEAKNNRVWFEEQASKGSPDDQYNLGLLCARIDEYDTAFKYYGLAAEQNHLLAKYRLANLYVDGKGVEKNLIKAEELFKPTADLGYFCTRKELSYFYWNQKKYSKALEYCRLNLKENCEFAQNMLAEAYMWGLGVEKNEKTAFEFFQMAAAQKLRSAQFWVGQCYSLGTGVTKDELEAVTWFKMAADDGLSIAQYNLGVYHYKKQLAKGLTSGAVKEFEDFFLAEYYLNKAAVQGDIQAQKILGQIQSGLHFSNPENDISDAAAMEQANRSRLLHSYQNLLASVKKDDPSAKFHLGSCFLEGRFHKFGLKIGSVEEGINLIKDAASQKSYNALVWLATAHLEGEYLSKDNFKALKYYSQVDLSERSGEWWHGMAHICFQLELTDFAKIPDNLKYIMKDCIGKETKQVQLEMRIYCLLQALDAFKNNKELPEAKQKEYISTIEGLLQITKYNLAHLGVIRPKLVRPTRASAPKPSQNQSIKIADNPHLTFAAPKNNSPIPGPTIGDNLENTEGEATNSTLIPK